MMKKKPEVIRVSNLAKTLAVFETMVEDMPNDDGQAGAAWIIHLIRKHYGIKEE